MTKRIAIIGAGTAGLSTAIFLSRLNFQCDLYEEVSEPQAIGAGILLQPQGLKILEELNLLQEVISKGSIIYNLYGENQKSSIVMDFNYADLCSGLFGLGIHRGNLFESLFNRAKQSIHRLVLGEKVIKITQNQKQAMVHTKNAGSKSYDMVVIANGTWSNLTDNLNLASKHKKYPWGALWHIFDNPQGFSQHVLNQRYQKCHTMAGFLPSGKDPLSNNKCISFFWSLKTDQFESWKNTNINKWKKTVINLWPAVSSFIEQITCHDDLTFVEYADTRMNQWHDSKIVVIGDAAHAMSPQLGQGANMALVDSWQLYHSLKQNPSIETALLHYSSARKKHLGYYQFTSRLLTPFFQSNSSIAAMSRDLIFPPMRYIPWAKKHALTTLFGVKESLFSNKSSIDLEKLSQQLNQK